MGKRSHKKIFYKSKDALQNIREECKGLSEGIEQLERIKKEKFERTLDMYLKTRESGRNSLGIRNSSQIPQKGPTGLLFFYQIICDAQSLLLR